MTDRQKDMLRAGDLHDERQVHLPGWFDVTAVSHPRVFLAFETISHDMGEGAGHDTYSVEESYVPMLEAAERGLATLTDEALQDFSIGDTADHDRMKTNNADLQVASTLLNGFFNDWDRDE